MKSSPSFVVKVMPFRSEVAVFRSLKKMKAYYNNTLGIHDDWFDSASANLGGATHHVHRKTGISWFGMYLSKKANAETIVHECSHIVDFIMDEHGVPISCENTEIRAYLLAELFGDVMDEMK